MEAWLDELLTRLRGEYAAQGIDWNDVGWDTRRRRLIALRWPSGAQSEAMQDLLNGRTAADGGKYDAMVADIAAIKAAVPKIAG